MLYHPDSALTAKSETTGARNIVSTTPAADDCAEWAESLVISDFNIGGSRSILLQLLASENVPQPRADTLAFDAATNI